MDTKSTLLTQYLTLLQLKLNCKLCSYKTAGSTVACKFSSSFLLFCLEGTLFIKIYLVFVFQTLPVNQWFHPLFLASAILFLFVFKLCMLSPLYYTTAPKEEISFYYKLDILALIWAVCMVPYKIVNLVALYRFVQPMP